MTMDALRITITGASGRMGQILADAVDENPDTRLVAVTERPGHDWIGKDFGIMRGGAARELIVSDDPVEAIAHCDAVLDFTAPAPTLEHAALAAQAHAAIVIGTTGFEESDFPSLSTAARHTAIVRAGNYSLGVNLLTELTRKVSRALGLGFDVEVVEMHHKHKVDAPSGTALMFGEAAAEGRGQVLSDVRDPARDGITGERSDGHIGFASLRGGDVVGEHDVIFAGPGERVVLRHLATDRMIFARGAVRAAIWAHAQKPGEYDMIDVLGLRS
jgi:4-hydroxy-tetrahydrodipicolinate reductase